TTLKRPGIVGGALHEAADQRALFATVTKETFRFTSPGEVERAVYAAAEAPRRPVLGRRRVRVRARRGGAARRGRGARAAGLDLAPADLGGRRGDRRGPRGRRARPPPRRADHHHLL